jgi:phosphopantetheinyl transferase
MELEAGIRIAKESGLPEPFRLDGHDPLGRPRAFAGGIAVPMSLSRCGAVRAVAVASRGRVGIDLVDPESAPETALLLDLLPDAEMRRCLDGPDPRIDALRAWACREALAKALGIGLGLDPLAFELEPAGEGLRIRRMAGLGTRTEGWHLEVGCGEPPYRGLVLALAWSA